MLFSLVFISYNKRHFFCKQAEIKPMVNGGIKGFKCFLIHSGVDEFPCVAEDDVRMAMKQMQGTDSVFLVCSIYGLEIYLIYK